jgi:DNA/RNA endonuclease YhcR with UshA esterase domain
MRLTKITITLTITGILLLTLISQNQEIKTATIESISQNQFKTTIKIQNSSTELIIFDNPKLNLSKGNKIKFQGKPDTYKNKSQIIITKLKGVKK